MEGWNNGAEKDFQFSNTPLLHCPMLLLFDIGNTNTHLGLANGRRVVRQTNLPTADWFGGAAAKRVRQFVGRVRPEGVALCSVVPRATPFVRQAIRAIWNLRPLVLTAKTLRGVGIDYPKPGTIGPDRLANAVAARHRFGAPVVVLDFGTAVTFDVVDFRGDYVGGIIAPGLAAMTDYLHEKTALLPRIKIREIRTSIGRSTEEAMVVGAVHGYRGLVRELIAELKRELKVKQLPVVATGGYAELMASKLPEISAVDPDLTLEGLRLVWLAS
jgi:type III pantothenate kinase